MVVTINRVKRAPLGSVRGVSNFALEICRAQYPGFPFLVGHTYYLYSVRNR